MTERVTINHDGEMVESSFPSAPINRSSDYQQTGVTVRDTKGIGSTRAISSQAEIGDTDLVQIDGMEISGKIARELGLLNRVIDESLSVGAVAGASERHAQAEAEAPAVDYGNDDLNAVSAALAERIGTGEMSQAEANDYETAVGEVALSGMTVSEVVETLDGLRGGTLGELDVSFDQRAVATAVESKVIASATASAKAELGAAGFRRLSEIAQFNPEVIDALRGYGLQRALGKTDASWADFLEQTENHVRGIR